MMYGGRSLMGKWARMEEGWMNTAISVMSAAEEEGWDW